MQATASRSRRGNAGKAAKREELILGHLALVKYTVSRISAHLPRHVDRDDLMEAGVVGLLDAAERFDIKRNVRFSTFAAPRVRGAMLDALRGEDWLPRSLRDEISRMDAARSALEQECSRPPTAEELSRRLHMKSRKLTRLTTIARRAAFHSIDDLPHGNFDEGRHPLRARHDPDLHPVERLELAEEKQRVVAALKELPENERLVVSLYYFEEMQLKEIAAILEVTSSRICQIHRSGLERLQRILNTASRPAQTACAEL